MGAVQPIVLVAVASLAFLVLFFLGDLPRKPLLAGLCIVLGLYCLVQCLPLPLSVLEIVAPINAEVWRESLIVAAGTAPTTATLSIDPRASLREALTWFCYAAVVLVALLTTQRDGSKKVFGAVLISTTLVALITLGHGILGAEKLYGVVERSFADGQWALSPLVNSNNLAGYLNLGFFAGASLLVTTRSTQRRVAIALAMTALAMLSLTSGSRGAMGTWLLGVASVGLIVLVGARRNPRRETRVSLGYLAALPLLVVALVAATFPEMALRTLDDKSLDKVHMIGWAAPLIRDHAWFGVGAGAFGTGFLPYRVQDDGVVWTHPENIVVGWLSELGVPMTLVLLGGIGFLFWRRRGQRFDAPRAIASVGLGMWFLHNLFDLAVTVPGVMVAALVMLAAVTEPLGEKVAAPILREGPARWPALVLAIAGLSLAGGVAMFALRTASQDRAALHTSLQKIEGTGKLPQDFFPSLADAVRRHPGDAYLFRLGAVAANFAPEQSPYRWLGRALDRDMTSAETHLLLARQLARGGSLNQALMEYRLAAERSVHLTGRIADEVANLTRDEALLRRVVPEGKPGSRMFSELGKRVARDRNGALRLSLFESAVARDPKDASAGLLLVDELLALVALDPEACTAKRPSCVEQLDALLSEMTHRTELPSPLAQRLFRLQSTWRARKGDPAGAVQSLLNKCSRSEPRCLEQAVTLSAEYDLPMEEPTKYYLAVACPSEDTCVHARRILARAEASRSHWGAALTHLREAAEQSNTAGDYLAAARMALRVGALPEVQRLLDLQKKATPPPSPAEQQAAQGIETQLTKQSRTLLLRDKPD